LDSSSFIESHQLKECILNLSNSLASDLKLKFKDGFQQLASIIALKHKAMHRDDLKGRRKTSMKALNKTLLDISLPHRRVLKYKMIECWYELGFKTGTWSDFVKKTFATLNSILLLLIDTQTNKEPLFSLLREGTKGDIRKVLESSLFVYEERKDIDKLAELLDKLANNIDEYGQFYANLFVWMIMFFGKIKQDRLDSRLILLNLYSSFNLVGSISCLSQNEGHDYGKVISIIASIALNHTIRPIEGDIYTKPAIFLCQKLVTLLASGPVDAHYFWSGFEEFLNKNTICPRIASKLPKDPGNASALDPSMMDEEIQDVYNLYVSESSSCDEDIIVPAQPSKKRKITTAKAVAVSSVPTGDPTILNDKTSDQLRDLLRVEGQPTDGTKTILQERLITLNKGYVKINPSTFNRMKRKHNMVEENADDDIIGIAV
jgi:hypothetical protein